MKNFKGFIKTVVLFIIAVILVIAVVVIYLNNQEDINQAKDDVKSATQEKKDTIIDNIVQDGKNSLGETLKNAGEKMLEDNSDFSQENNDQPVE
ncbi:MAG: hypothetical protein KAT32_01530 [Candidatus Moranbacteria bacterium]|nr:hypothetical protein [Candidatus Moranbacteria bacterium]